MDIRGTAASPADKIKGRTFPERLLPAIRQFLYDIQKQRLPHHFKATVIVHSASCFSKQVVSCHENIPLAAVYFGNIQGGVFINHWECN
ncbi:hypothetical protein COOONC_01499 [Cooperia oncophora]